MIGSEKRKPEGNEIELVRRRRKPRSSIIGERIKLCVVLDQIDIPHGGIGQGGRDSVRVDRFLVQGPGRRRFANNYSAAVRTKPWLHLFVFFVVFFCVVLFGSGGANPRGLAADLDEALDDMVDAAFVDVEGGDSHERGAD